MSQSAFETVNNILEIWKIVIQAIMFFVLWGAVFRGKKGKGDGIAAALFILVNIGMGFLPCASWVRYAVSALPVMGYGWINYKKQIGKVAFVMLAFYNLHCLSFLIANSVYMKVTNIMMKNLDASQDGYWQQAYHCLSVGMAASVFFYTVLFVAISRLKGRDREILFARVYGELTFAQLGERFHMEPKQAEMAYYYVLKKLRKEMGGKDEF